MEVWEHPFSLVTTIFRRARWRNARLTPALCDMLSLLLDDPLQFRVLNDDTESGRHWGATLSEELTALQLNPFSRIRICG